MRTLRLLLLASMIAIAVFGGWQASHAQDNFEYFFDTGHVVRGEFLAFFHLVNNPLELYGYPITEAFQDSATGLTVQYFERARFELHPAEPAESRVQLSPLGEFLHVSGLPQIAIGDTAPCRSFPPDGYLVCYDFLEFYLANGGMEQFGPPISNMELLNDTKVQHFRNARLEWRPGRDGESWIVPAKVGWEYFYKIGEDPRRTAAVEPITDGGAGQLKPRAQAYPQYAVTARTATQTIYILVHDQRYLPIEAADMAVVVRWPSGAESRFIASTATDADGITHISFPINSHEIGLVTIEVEGTYDRIPIRTVTSFRIWW